MRRKNFILIMVGFVFSLCFTFGCQDKEAMAELEAMKAQAEIVEQNKALIIRLYDELNKGNIEIINELYASDYVYYIPSRSTSPMSREETLEMTKNVYRVFPDIHVSLEELIAVGDRVYTGIPQGELTKKNGRESFQLGIRLKLVGLS